MRKLTIIKTGNMPPELTNGQGDFEDLILKGMAFNKEDSVVISVFQGDALPPYEDVSGIVITGSLDMVTDHLDWSERTAQWLPAAVEQGIPTLGICYGHQLLAYAMGGEVGPNPRGLDFGTTDAILEPGSQVDLLLGGLPSPFKAQVSHFESVLRLPPGAHRLAHSQGEANLAYAVGEQAWGVQFHPEFDASICKAIIDETRTDLSRDGRDAEVLIRAVEETPLAAGVLKRFADVVKTNGSKGK